MFTSFLARVLRIEGLDEAEHRRTVQVALGLAAGAVLLRFIFWWYTGRVWEDALITVLHSENFVRGLGLTHYRTGQPPLHGFTSPLSVLVPLVGDLMKVGFGISFIKLVSAFAGGLTVLYVMAIAIHPRVRLSTPLAAMAMGYVALEHHQILFGMAGMETQIATLTLLMAVYYTMTGPPVHLGVSLGLCMLARPDYAFWTAIAGLYLLGANRHTLWRAVPIALALYLPWIVFTTLYYGSPVPNTIIAKNIAGQIADVHPLVTFSDVWQRFVERSVGEYNAFQPLGVSFAGHGIGFIPLIPAHEFIQHALLAAALLGLFAILYARQWPLLPLALFVVVYAAYYIFLVPLLTAWYLVPFAAATVLLSVRGFQAASGCIKTPKWRNAVLIPGVALYLACIAGVLPKTFTTEKRIQQDIENVVRKPAALFLNHIMAPDESVGCEPLGYVSYYSGRTVYDWPGLANRRVVDYLRTQTYHRCLLTDMLKHFRPDFLFLRYSEYSSNCTGEWVDDDYEIIASFEAPTERIRDIFEMTRNTDTGFFVLARRDKLPGLIQRCGNPPGIAPNHAKAYMARAIRAGVQQRYPEAMDFARKAVQLEPRYSRSHLCLAMILTWQQRHEEAIAELGEAIRVEPHDAYPYLTLASLRVLKQDYEDAENLYRKVLDIAPRNKEARHALQRLALYKEVRDMQQTRHAQHPS